jgi:hypothetical protein
MNDLERKLFANEISLLNVEFFKRSRKLADDDPAYLQIKRNIEETFEKHKQEYKKLTGNDYINRLK